MEDQKVISSARLETLPRRERFRRYMAAFNPTAPARSLIKGGMVLEDLHPSLFQGLAARADLEPGSQQLVIGGIGSGKTTELLLAQSWLRRQGETIPRYIDITAETDLSSLASGALLAALGLDLIRLSNLANVPPESGSPEAALQKAKTDLREFALGKTVQRWVEEDDDFEYQSDEGDYDDPEPPSGYYRTENTPGKLKPPIPRLKKDVQDIRESLALMLHQVTKYRGEGKELVVLYDGLDRLITPDKFWAVVFQDLKLLKQLRVSVIATAPLSVLYEGREIAEHFDRVHHLAALSTEGPGQSKLESVLLKRGGDLLLSRQQMTQLSLGSGGVLRDLIALARDSAEEAYVAGTDGVSDVQIDSAINQLGTSYLRGLSTAQRNKLKMIHKTKECDFSQHVNIELLATRRILEYSATSCGVHPALVRVLDELEKESA